MGLQDWLIRVALIKGVKRGAEMLGVILTTGKVDYMLKQIGVTINPTLFAGGLYMAFEFGRNYLKVKKGYNWL